MNRKVRTRGIIDPLRNYDRRPVKRHRTEVEDGNIRPQEECEGELFQKQAQKQKSNGKRQSKIVNADTNSARALSSEFSSPLSCPATPVIPFAASLFNSEMIGTASNNYSNNYNDDDSNNAKNNNKNNSKVLIPDEDNVDFEFNELALKKRKMTLPKQPMLSKNSSSYLLNIPFAEDFEIDKILREQESSEDLIINHGVEKFKQIIDLLDPAYFLPTPEDQNENEMDLNYSDTSNSALFLQSASFIRENNFANISPIFPAQNVELRIPIASNPDTESEKIPSMSQYFENSFDFESFEHEDHTEDDDSSIQGIENGVGGVATNNV
ncbi:hypothetical protein HK100_004541 [Physocladia obscura]|uniref:Uncharacterized protein n=1 Tax=Physocladia obscura TaxID=109957 RepID=A0AAD5SVJ1_9FUNG|nr:hypothetical protein HK100_004541 [Physocladia obscura]